MAVNPQAPLIDPLTVSGLLETLPHVWVAANATFDETVCAPAPFCNVMPPTPMVSVLVPPTVTVPVAPAAKLRLRTDASCPRVVGRSPALLLK